MFSFLTKIFGDPSEKKLQSYRKELEAIKKIEAKYRDEITSLEQVQAKTHEFQSKFEGLDITDDDDKKKIKEILETIKHEAFALHRRTCELIHGQTFELDANTQFEWNMVPYDVQMLGALALHDGNISEMKTGEGKTLVATIAAYLNALVGNSVHIVTVNDYLARRDAKEMGIIYKALGLSVGVISHGQSFEEKKHSYSRDVVYATNNELGFDYLRDNMAVSDENRVMSTLWYAIIDEVDSILVDEARTPLIISAPSAEPTSQYMRFAAIARKLSENTDYKIDEKQKTATLTEEGINALEKILGVDNIYVSQHYNDIHHIENALKASTVYKKDIDYLLRNDASAAEVDCNWLDEARTPLIISAPSAEPTSQYMRFAAIARKLSENTDYKIDEKQKTATLTEEGINALEKILGVDNIYVSQHYNDIHHIENALKASTVYKKDIDYLLRNDEIMIIDEHTGRVLPGRRYSDGLHQAIEAKENATIQEESRTLASVTFQNYFRLYKKLSGMTGTAKTEEEEFYKIYNLEVICVPTNRPVIREDRGDLLFRSEKGKFDYITNLVEKLYEKGQPVLIGTVSVAKSEYLSHLLEQKNIPHNVLNAKHDSKEAEIVGAAGKYKAVTIATNMAGRGTDIKIDDRVRNLSGTVTIEGKAGKQEYPLGGLYIIGTEKHETRRIDNQLRGRSGRQGDPGLSQFMISPQDDIMRIFGGNKLFSILARFESHPENDPLVESKMLTRNIESIQKQVEGRNFDIRKHILEYDDVLNQHRLAIYARRNRILKGNDIHQEILDMLEHQIQSIVSSVYDIHNEIDSAYVTDIVKEINDFAESEVISRDDVANIETSEDMLTRVKTLLAGKIENLRSQGDEETFSDFERQLTLASIDEMWMQHIDKMAHLREEVAFEGYAQKNPLVVYKERAYEGFMNLINDLEFRVIKALLTAKPAEAIESVELESALRSDYTETATASHESANLLQKISDDFPGLPNTEKVESNDGVRVIKVQTPQQNPENIDMNNTPKNAQCPCGSGKKFKTCHGKNL
ncbi:preprotein translocase subunit SecA [Candidatus Gracilibacteria bacterium]|nr:preprotein translocase subunit SecA [Candidatus Gracilibacteria bacterium]MBS9783747.1 preprotein translocase subunit SecA [Candidatus Gracilibacteria bacterium]